MEKNSNIQRIFLFSLSGLGAGAMPDAKLYHCSKANTLRSLFQTGKMRIPQLQRLGIGQINGLSFLGGNNYSSSIIAKIAQRSENKDRFTGISELLGNISAKSLPVYPQGLPFTVLKNIEDAIHSHVIGNVQSSKLDAVMQFGMEHCDTREPIIFTSVDSSLYIAGHVSVINPDRLNEMAHEIRRLMKSQHAVGKVISVPFSGKWPYFTLTSGGETLSNDLNQPNILDILLQSGFDVFSFNCFQLVDNRFQYHCIQRMNHEAFEWIEEIKKNSFRGLCFVPFTEFEDRFGLHHDAIGYALALNRFDDWLAGFVTDMQPQDLLIITSDGGCDPSNTLYNERTREYVPLIVYGKTTFPTNLGVKIGICDVSASIAAILDIHYSLDGTSYI